MPGVTKYNLVDDAHDLRIPMHNDEVFKHGVCFEAKYIGSLEVGRPGSRMEIVAAMRRIRRKGWSWDDNITLVTQDPIFRIFYVSHDAQDLKIFSYIARDGQSNNFRCNVFKSKRKSQAMRIVRTVGQAFDVCHQLTLQQKSDDQEDEEGRAEESEAMPAKKRFVLSEETDLEATTEESIEECVSLSDLERGKKEEAFCNDGKVSDNPSLLLSSPILGACVSGQSAAEAPCSDEHQVQLLQRQLQQQEQQALAASAQVHVLQEQLSVEVCARTDAQARVQRLLQQNTDLLQHISLLVKQIQELELKAAGRLTSMGSQDSLLEITFRAKPSTAPREPLTTSSSMGTLATQSLLQISDSAWVPGPCSPGTRGMDTSPLGLSSSGVRLECFRFSSRGPESQEQGLDTGETPSDGVPDDSSLLGEQVLGALELLRFRESGIGSEYESNTDESDDRDSWGQGEGVMADGAARLLNVLNAESLPDCLGDEMAV
ncbi:PDZ ligand of neuronal nitric oxide synthase protein C-terminal [Collichthys lucidus]|uniref:PDZ ligand of neuronal nitric oxide synthase protein C-terminal n=1 Tax=Collichthys lucidus TaxID=240159 RepID=A0A4U5UXU5_COLLU|nr:PDZ ligand of neuronal nitric oxide synthase protein C-terminal [Collichthys lucidus]